ncbi:N-formylglutamate amidohydrolase [soil metagenome]
MSAFTVREGSGPIVATAIHAGHELRDEVARAMLLDDATRLLEEDPFTDRIAVLALQSLSPTQLVAHRSRFEVDLNRPRATAVYVRPEDAWGLNVWREPPSPLLIASSLGVYDDFYAQLERVLRARIAENGYAVVLDLHSYNHRRGPDRSPADEQANPAINLGTRSADRLRWGTVIDRFMTELADAGSFDVRENVKFGGGAMAQWIHATFPTTALTLSIEFKKTFMDEWSGVPDEAHLDRLGRGIAATIPGLLDAAAAR